MPLTPCQSYDTWVVFFLLSQVLRLVGLAEMPNVQSDQLAMLEAMARTATVQTDQLATLEAMARAWTNNYIGTNNNGSFHVQ